MQEPTDLHTDPPLRFRLSARGQATEAAYPESIVRAPHVVGREAIERARAEWAFSHGLEPDDGAYFFELRLVPRTASQLGEALAICGQSREMVLETIDRLILAGFVETAAQDDSQLARLDLDRAQQELTEAQIQLDVVSRRLEANSIGDRQMITAALRQAVSRVLVARRFLATLSDPS